MTFVVMYLYYKLTCTNNFSDKYFIVVIIFIVIVIASQ